MFAASCDLQSNDTMFTVARRVSPAGGDDGIGGAGYACEAIAVAAPPVETAKARNPTVTSAPSCTQGLLVNTLKINGRRPSDPGLQQLENLPPVPTFLTVENHRS